MPTARSATQVANITAAMGPGTELFTRVTCALGEAVDMSRGSAAAETGIESSPRIPNPGRHLGQPSTPPGFSFRCSCPELAAMRSC